MQVLNSPTRPEVDTAHAAKRYLEIGVLSIPNIIYLSWFKRISWATFVLSSVPIHLLFNSTIFETDYQGSEWQMTMVSSSFLNGGSYYPPGASLMPAGFGNRPGDSTAAVAANIITIADGVVDIPMKEYLNKSSETARNLSVTAAASQGVEALRGARLPSGVRVLQASEAIPRQGHGTLG